MANPLKNIVQFFFEQVDLHPLQPAIIEKNKSVTYSQLADEVMQMVTYCKAKGIKAGDRVMVFVPMSIDLYRSVLALFSMGATAVFVDEWSDKNRLRQACELAQCKGFIGNWKAKIYAWLEPSLRRIPIKLNPKGFYKYAPDKGVRTVDFNQEALVTFTTGSTGKPKGAQRTHGFLMEQLKAIQSTTALKPGTVAMSNLPIVQFIFLSTGMTAVLPTMNHRNLSLFDPKLVLTQMNKHGVKLCIASPFIALELAKSYLQDQQPQAKNNPLRNLYVGGGAVFSKDAKLLQKAFPKSNVRIVYGSTEAEPISLVHADELININSKQGLLVGEAHEFTKLKVVPISTFPEEIETIDKIALPANRIGEIVVAGNHVLENYIGEKSNWMEQKIKTDTALWHRTGDSGFIDNEGRIWLTGRCKQLIALETGNYIAPFIIEDQLANLPEMVEGTIVQKDGKIQVFLVLNSTLSSESKGKINEWLAPQDFNIHIIRSMPKDIRHHTKIDYAKLVS